jgi:hypothetical protein
MYYGCRSWERPRIERKEKQMENREPEDVVLVPVPKSKLGVVYEALARSMGESVIAGSSPVAVQASGAVAVQVPGQGKWTEAMVDRLEIDFGYKATRMLFTMMAERAPRSVSFTEAVTEVGVERNKLRGELAALSKITKRLFGEKTWPCSWKTSETGEIVYWMEPEVAKWWLRAAEKGTG